MERSTSVLRLHLIETPSTVTQSFTHLLALSTLADAGKGFGCGATDSELTAAAGVFSICTCVMADGISGNLVTFMPGLINFTRFTSPLSA